MIEVIVVDTALFKLQNPCLSHPSHSNSNINIIIPYFLKSSFSIAKILKQHNFKVIFSPVIKLSLSKLKDPIDTLNIWGIYSISYQYGLLYIGQTKHRLCFHLYEHKHNIQI